MTILKPVYSLLALFALTTLFACSYSEKQTDNSISPGPSEAERERERQRQLQAKRDAEFSSFRQCHANITKQNTGLADIFSDALTLSCLTQEQTALLEKTRQKLEAQIEAYAAAYDGSPTQDIGKELHEKAQKDIEATLSAYNEIQAMLSYCRSEHILSGAQGSPEILSGHGDNLFLVALGDVFGADSGFEGSRSKITLSHRLHALKIIEAQSKGHTFIKDEAQAHPCHHNGAPHPDFPEGLLAKLIAQSENALSLENAFRGSLLELQSEMDRQLKRLKQGESIFLPFGWTGHAFEPQFTRENENDKDPSYTFRVFNSGEGIESFHAYSLSGYNLSYFPYLEMAEVSHASLTSFVVLAALQEVAHPETYSSEPKDLYERVIRQLDGKRSAQTHTFDNFRDPQQAGTCTYFSLPWVLDSSVAQMLPKNDYQNREQIPARIEYLIGALTVRGYQQKLKSDENDDRLERKLSLLKKGLTFFSAQTLQSNKNGALDFGDLTALANISEEIAPEILAKENFIRSQYYLDSGVTLKSNKRFGNVGGDVTSSFRSVIDRNETSVNVRSLVFNYSEWILPADKATLIEELEGKVGELESAQKASHFVEVMNAARDLAKRLPLSEKTYWSHTTDQEATKIISLLHKLQMIYVFSLTKAILKETNEKQYSTTDFLVALKILSLCDMLNTHFVSSVSPAIPSLYQAHFNWVLSKKSALVEITHPDWATELKTIRSYFESQKGNSFFGLDQIPAGVSFNAARRLFHDEKAVKQLKDNQKHWSDEVEWPDFEWALRYMRKQPGYASSLNHLKTQSESKSHRDPDFIAPFHFFYGVFDKALNNGITEPADESRVDSELPRREAIKLLVGDRSARLPDLFYHLRDISFLADFLLTGQLDKASAKSLRYERGVRFLSNQAEESFAKPTGRTIEVNAHEDEWTCIERDEYGICRSHRTIKKAVRRQVELYMRTDLKATLLNFSLFGAEELGNYDKDQRVDELKEDHGKQIPFRYTRPHVHAQGGFKPFAQSETDYADGIDFHHDELMKIYMSGVANKDKKPILDPLIEQERRRLLSNDLILADPNKETLTKLTLERIRDVFTLSSDKNLQIIETLALFDKFPSLLFKPEYQRIFEKLVFEPGLMQRQFQIDAHETERFLKSLLKFYTEHFELAHKRRNLKAMAFILQMNQRFTIEWGYAKTQKSTKRNDGTKAHFIDTPQKLFDLANGLESDQWQQRSYLCRGILESYLEVSDFSDHDIELLLFAAIEHRILAIADEKWIDLFAEAEVRNVLVQKQSAIQKALLGQDGEISDRGQTILKWVTKRLRPDVTLTSNFSALSPSKTGLLFGSQARRLIKAAAFQVGTRSRAGTSVIQIDVNSGSFYDAGQPHVRFPIPASEYKAVFGTETHKSEVAQIAKETYEWTGGNGDSYRAMDLPPHNWRFQRMHAEKWYEFVADHEIDFKTQGFFRGYDHWQSTGSETSRTFLVYDKETKKLAYTTTAQCNGDDASLCTVHSVARAKDGAVLAHVSNETYPVSVLSQIEAPRDIYVWLPSQSSTQIMEVELPRLNLVFKPIAGSKRLDCGPFEKHQIASVQYSGLLHKPRNYLLCEPTSLSNSSPRLAITPVAPFLRGDRGTLDPIDFARDEEKRLGAKLAVYKVPALHDGMEAEGTIEPTSDLARLYLALRKLEQLDYRAAKENISLVTKSDRKLSAENGELSVLSMLAAARADQDPRATAVRLLAAINLLKQSSYFSAGSSIHIRVVSFLYERYLENIAAIGDAWIPYFDEYFLAKTLAEQEQLSNASLGRMSVLKSRHPSFDIPPPIDFEAYFGFPFSFGQISDNPFKTLQEVGGMLDAERSTDTPKGAVLSPKAAIKADNFDLLYDIAHGRDFDPARAHSLLRTLVTELPTAQLSQSALRQEWVRIFGLNANEKDTPGTLSRFFALLAHIKDRSTLPSASALRAAIAKELRLNNQIKLLDQQINEVISQISSLREPRKSTYSYDEQSQIWSDKDDPEYPSKIAAYHGQKKALEERLASLRKTKSETEAELQKLRDHFEEVLFAKVNREVIDAAPLAPTIAPGKQPARDFVHNGAREASAEITQSDASFGEATDLLKEPLFAKDGAVFEAIVLSAKDKAQIRDDMTTLKAALDKGKNGPSQVVAGINSLKQGLDTYEKTLLAETVHYRLKTPKALDGIITSLAKTIREQETQKLVLVKEALRLARKQSALFTQASYQRLAQIAEASRDLTIDELIQLLATNRLKDLYDGTHGRLSLEDLTALKTTLYKILLANTYVMHASNLVKEIKTLQSLSGVRSDSELHKAAVDKVVSLGQMKRTYDPTKHVEYLMLEQYMGFLLRKDQVASLDELDIKEGVVNNAKALGGVIEMIMGSGKTTVLLPLLSILNSKDEWLNIVMLPEALIASMAKQLSQQLHTSFGLAVDIIEISRGTPLKATNLSGLYDRFLRAQLEHRTIIMTNSSMQSLFLSYVAALYEYSNGNKNYEQAISEFVKIFQLLRKSGRLTIDEADLALDILQSHQFSIGARLPVNKTLSNTAFVFYRHLLSHDFNLRWPFIPGAKGEAFTSSSYAAAKPSIIQSIARDGQLFNKVEGLDKSYRYFVAKAENQNLLINYLSSNKMRDRDALLSAIDKSFASRPSELVDMKNIVSVLYEEINHVFLLSAGKKLAIHYGPLPEPKQNKEADETEDDFRKRQSEYRRSKFIAIPYHAGNAVVNSRFGTALEALNYTIQMQLEQKRYLLQMHLEIEELKRLEEQEDPRFDLRFDELRKGDPISVYDIDSERLSKWHTRLAQGKELGLELSLLHNFVLPQIKTYQVQLQTNAQIYESLFHNVQGFSGTLWSVDTFPNVFRAPVLSDTAEKTFYLLWAKHQARKRKDSSYNAIRALNKTSLHDSFDWAFRGSLIDDGGLFRGIDNLSIAKELAHNTTQDVIYYDHENNIAVFRPDADNGESVVALEEPHTAQSGRIAYWDKKHTTGSDLKLVPDMSARMSFDYHTLSRDLQQSVWRLRGLEGNQSIDQFLVLDEDLNVIRTRMKDVLGLSDSATFDLGDLILYSVMNQELRLSDLLYRSVKQKMKNAVISDAMDQMLNGQHSPIELGSLFSKVSSLFAKDLILEPYHYAGFPSAPEDKSAVLEKDKRAILGAYKSFAHIDGKINDIIAKDTPKLPMKINTSGLDDGLEVEIELETEQEKDIEQEVDRVIEQYEFNSQFTAHDILQWPYQQINDLFEQDYFEPNDRTKLDARPLATLKDALVNNRLDWIADIVSKDVFVSLNFAPLHYRQRWGSAGDMHYEFEFFSLYQKTLTNLLVTIDRDNRLQLVLIDGNDASQFDTALKSDYEALERLVGRDRRIALFSLAEGVFRSGHEAIDTHELEGDQRFIEMLTQIKFLNGELRYSDKELAYLERWLVENDVEKMYLLFDTQILAYKQDSRDRFKCSQIGRLFDDLRILRD